MKDFTDTQNVWTSCAWPVRTYYSPYFPLLNGCEHQANPLSSYGHGGTGIKSVIYGWNCKHCGGWMPNLERAA